MKKFLKKRLKDEKGAVDKILVTLLLSILGLSIIVGYNTFSDKDEITEKKTVEKSSVDK